MKTTPERFVLGFIKFLGTPLAVAALLAAMVAVTRAREGNWERAALAASIAIACAGAGIGAIWWVRLHARGVDPSERLRAANPDTPWMWREDWAAGEVRTSARRDANRLTIIAIAWCVATFPIFFIAPHRALRDADYFSLPSLIFPLIGVVDADVGDAHAAALPRIRRVALRDGVSAGTNRRRAHRLDSYRQACCPPDSKSRSNSNASTARRAATGTV